MGLDSQAVFVKITNSANPPMNQNLVFEGIVGVGAGVEIGNSGVTLDISDLSAAVTFNGTPTGGGEIRVEIFIPDGTGAFDNEMLVSQGSNFGPGVVGFATPSVSDTTRTIDGVTYDGSLLVFGITPLGFQPGVAANQTVSFTVEDVPSGTGVLTVPPTITSNGGNDTAAINVAENTTAVTDVQTTDDDSEGAGLTYSLSGGADQALFSINASTGVLSFTNAPDFETPLDAGGDNVYDVQVTVTDSDAQTDAQDIAVTVTDVVENTAPEITTDAAVSVAENTTSVIDVQSSDDNDSEGSGLTYSVSGGADSALFGINASTGALSFNNAPDFESPGDVGGDNIYDVQVTVTDSGSLTDVQDIAVTVTNVNEAPTANDDAITIGQNTTFSSGVPAGLIGGIVSVPFNFIADTDPEGDTLTVISVDGDAANVGAQFTTGGGALATIGADGSISYDNNDAFDSLAAGETATDTITYTVSDGNGGMDTATLTVTLIGINDAPVANDDDIMVGENGFFFTDLRGNDTDAEGDDLTIISNTGGIVIDANGQTITTDGGRELAIFLGDGVNPNGSQANNTIIVNPNANGAFDDLAFGETDTVSFDYTVSDGNGGTDTATVNITINGENDDPTANDDSGAGFTTDEDTAFTTASVVANDTDPDTSDTLLPISIDTTGTVGLVTSNMDGTFNYDPNGQFETLAAGESTTDTFSYTVGDGNGGTDTATVTVTINGVNDDPVANDDTGAGFVTDEDSAFTTANVLDNDTDVDASDTLSVASVDTTGTIGTVTNNGDGTFGYDPGLAFQYLSNGESAYDTFSYAVSDGNGGWDEAEVTIEVTGSAEFIGGTDRRDRLFGSDFQDEIKASGGNDLVYGEDGDDIICGEDGRDNLYGDRGDDTIDGGEGKDRILGGAGDDVLIGGEDDDVINGGNGFDTAVFSGDFGDYAINFRNTSGSVRGEDGFDRLSGIEALVFDDGVYDVVNDVFTPNPAPIVNAQAALSIFDDSGTTDQFSFSSQSINQSDFDII